MNRTMITMLAALALAPAAAAQHFDMSQWGSDRGYTQAPYFRYEAERDYCRDFSGQYLERTDDQLYLQSEASNQQAVTLSRDGFVRWQNDTGDADGLTLRFSVPWDTSATVAVCGSDGSVLGSMTLDTGHSWEYCNKIKGSRTYKPEIYSRHVKDDNEFVRMRFDEKHCLLSRDIRNGEEFSIVNLSDVPVTVDFVEIEKARKVEYQDGWVRWNQDINNNLQNFIDLNPGKTIYIDQEYVGIWGSLNPGSCTLQGRGIFYTELHWEQNGAGFGSFSGRVKDMYLSSYQQQRYDSPDHGPNNYGSPGKCFNGSANAENVLVEHFECGAWLSGANGSTFRHCRFRNNYADGINFCNSSNCVAEQCSFRNNGDDDMASWSAQAYCSNNTYRYCTAEHNWRASSLGFFGGGGHRAEHILIKDGLESGVRIVADFSGPAFGSEGIDFSDISIVHCACVNGEVGRHGDFWGVDEAALHIEASANYDLQNPRFRNIDIIDSRGNAVYIGSSVEDSNGNYKSINGLSIEGINIDGVGDGYAFYFESPRGNGTVNDIELTDVPESQVTNIAGGLQSGTVGDFNLTTTGVETAPVVLIPGLELRLTAMSWQVVTASRANDISEGDRVRFTVPIENHSAIDLPADYPMTVKLAFDDGTALRFPVHKTGIPAYSYVTVDCEWTAKAGGRTVTATLDPDNRYDYMTPADKGSVQKKINVTLKDISSLSYDATSGVDFQPLDLRWKTQRDTGYGKGSIYAGDAVTFAAVVANTGTKNSDGGSKLGVIISPSGNTWSQGDNDIRWCDANEAYEALNPGEVKYFPAYGGNGSSDGKWTARDGNYNVLVQVNDHANESGNRSEDNTANNQRKFSLSIPFQASGLHAQADLPDNIDNIMTGLTDDVTVIGTPDDRWYTLTGILLAEAPVVPGIYINAGRKVVIR